MLADLPNGDLALEDENFTEEMPPIDEGEHESEYIQSTDRTVDNEEKSSSSNGVVRRVENEAKQRELRRSLETKEQCTHLVHCPFFPNASMILIIIHLLNTSTF